MLYYIYIILYVHYIILHYIILYYIILCTYVCVYGYNPHKSESATSVESNRSTSHKSTIPENSHGSWKMYKSDLLKILIIFHYWIYLGKLYHIYWFTKLSSSLFFVQISPIHSPSMVTSHPCSSRNRFQRQLRLQPALALEARACLATILRIQVLVSESRWSPVFSNSSCSTLW